MLSKMAEEFWWGRGYQKTIYLDEYFVAKEWLDEVEQKDLSEVLDPEDRTLGIHKARIEDLEERVKIAISEWQDSLQEPITEWIITWVEIPVKVEK
jgi:hypothetical protein